MKEIGQLIEDDGRFEVRIPEMSLVIRGDYPEWVMQAASDVITNTKKAEYESIVDEKETLLEFGEASETDVDSAKFNMKQRFEIVPQCIVTMGRLDYKWIAREGRDKLNGEFDGQAVRRIHDMSLTMNDSFLKDDDGVNMSDDQPSQ
ncbi:MAG: hypothetical protein AAGA87_05700 [Pseudomonadota bacterium]